MSGHRVMSLSNHKFADQVALGYASNIFEDKYSVEVETYYKKVQNRLDYIDGANLVANEAIEACVTFRRK